MLIETNHWSVDHEDTALDSAVLKMAYTNENHIYSAYIYVYVTILPGLKIDVMIDSTPKNSSLFHKLSELVP